MTKPVRPDLGHSGALACGVDDRGDSPRGQPHSRSDRPEEHRPGLGSWSTSAHVAGHRGTDIMSQRQSLVVATLAVHEDLASSPVDVVEAQAGDFAGSESK